MICRICGEDINEKGQDNISPICGYPICEDCKDDIMCDECCESYGLFYVEEYDKILCLRGLDDFCDNLLKELVGADNETR